MNLVRKKLQHSLHNKQCFIATLFCFYDYNAATTADVRIVYITNLLSRSLKTIFQHKACTVKLYADSFYKVQKNSHSSFEVICCCS